MSGAGGVDSNRRVDWSDVEGASGPGAPAQPDATAAPPSPGASLAVRVGSLLERGETAQARKVLSDLATRVNQRDGTPAAVDAAAKRLSDAVVKLAADGRLRAKLYGDVPTTDQAEEAMTWIRRALVDMGTDEARAAWPPVSYRAVRPKGDEWAKSFEYHMERREPEPVRAMVDRLAYTGDLDPSDENHRAELGRRKQLLSSLVVQLDRDGKLPAFKKTIEGVPARDMDRAIESLASDAAKAAWKKHR